MIIFDIETEGLPAAELSRLVPEFDASAAVPDAGEFDAGSVKLGNVKDPEKVAAKIAESRARHEEERSTLAARREAARLAHESKFSERAASSPLTGRVLAIGVNALGGGEFSEGRIMAVDETVGLTVASGTEAMGGSLISFDRYGDEGSLLAAFWDVIHGSHRGELIVGHNIFGFDLPFLVTRSWILGVPIPEWVVKFSGKFPNWSPRFVDTMERWGFGRGMVSLNDVSLSCGGPGKPAGSGGADFAPDYRAGGDRRQKALSYLVNDLAMSLRAAEGCGLL